MELYREVMVGENHPVKSMNTPLSYFMKSKVVSSRYEQSA